MRTMKWLASLLVVCLAVTFCKNDEPQVPVKDETPAALLSVKILAADNPGIVEEDLAVDAIAESMILRVVGGGVGKEITVTLTAGENDEIKVNDEAVDEDGKAVFDATYPADIVVTNTKSEKKAAYVLKIGKILEIVGQPVALFQGGPERLWGGPLLTVSPKDDMPYIVYTRKDITRIYEDEKDGEVTIKADMESNPHAKAVRWTGSAFQTVGPDPFSDNGEFAKGTTVVEAVDAAPNGDVYVVLRAEKNSSRLTVQKFDGSAWSYVGGNGPDPGPSEGVKDKDNEHEINSTNVTSPARQADLFFVGGKPSFIFKGNQKDVDKYEALLFEYDGSAWNQSVGLPGLPKYADDKKTAFWGSRSVVVGDVAYVLAQSNGKGYYLLKKEKGVWTTVVDNYIPEGAPYGLIGSIEIAASPSGQVFIFVVHDTDSPVIQAYRVDSSGNLEPYAGPATSVSVTSSGSVEQEVRFGINPVSGQVIAVRCGSLTSEGAKNPDDHDLYFAMIDENRQWTEWTKIGGAPVTGDLSSMAFTSDGSAYVAYETSFTLNGYTSAGQIQLVRIGLEADILPE